MTILVGSDVPGLLGALEHILGGSQRLAVVRDADTISGLISNPSFRLDALILSDTIAPLANKDVATSLWEIISYMSRYRQPVTPVVLTLSKETPTVIQDALRNEVRKTGGDLHLMSHRARTPDHQEARQAVAWIVGQLRLEPQRRQFSIVPINYAHGVGSTTTTMHFCLQLNRLGLRILVVDLHTPHNQLQSWFRIREELPGYLGTLASNYPDIIDMYPPELIEQRIFHHRSGLDLLFAAPASVSAPAATIPWLDPITASLALLDYDVVCYDLPTSQYRTPAVRALLSHPTTSPFVICPPGRKEREGAAAIFGHLAEIERPQGRSALSTTMALFIEGERGQAISIRSVRQELLHTYPAITHLATLPRDPALLSTASERNEFSSAFELAPTRPYCHAIRGAARSWFSAIDLPATWLTRSDPYEQRPKRRFWARQRRATALPLPPLPNE